MGKLELNTTSFISKKVFFIKEIKNDKQNSISSVANLQLEEITPKLLRV